MEKTVTNPSQLLRAVGTIIHSEFVRTCKSDTCTCASHDAGYDQVTLSVPDWVVVRKLGGSVHSHPSATVDIQASLAAASAAGASKTREAGLLRLEQIRLNQEAAEKAKAERLRKKKAYEERRKALITAWMEAGLDAQRIWKQKLQWAGEQKVIELASKLAVIHPFYAPSFRAFEREAGFATPLSFPRTQTAMLMAWGKLPDKEGWRDVAARVGVTVR